MTVFFIAFPICPRHRHLSRTLQNLTTAEKLVRFLISPSYCLIVYLQVSPVGLVAVDHSVLRHQLCQEDLDGQHGVPGT